MKLIHTHNYLKYVSLSMIAIMIGILSVSNAKAQSFSRHTIDDNIPGAFRVFPFDIDGDGDMDILTGSSADNPIAWFENNGEAIPDFIKREVSGSISGPASVFAADLDKDGDIDIAVASVSDNTIAWLENSGNNTFVENVISSSAGGAHNMYATDIDGDSDLDLIAALYEDDEIVVYLNNGAANPLFTQTITVSGAADGAQHVTAADIDGDGDMDLASASYNDDKIAWYENDGAATPGFTTHTVSTLADGAKSVYAADIDGDGDIDLASASYEDDKIAWYENNGAEVFTTHIISTTAEGAHSVYVADVDSDDDMDLVTALYDEDQIVVYKNDGAANPGFSVEVVSYTADGAQHVFVEDINGDGNSDLLSASSIDNTFEWYEKTGFIEVNSSAPAQNAMSVAADSDIQVTFSSAIDGSTLDASGIRVTGSQTGTIEGSLTGGGTTAITFNPSQDFKPGETITVTIRQKWRNTEGSYLKHPYSYQFIVRSNNLINPAPVFSANEITNQADGVQSVVAADIDGDGDMDFASASNDDNTIAWYENDGSEMFTLHTVSSSALAAQQVVAADIDGDGDMDLASASYSDNKIAWYENNGSESFTPHSVTTSAMNARSVFAADIDGDGDMDLASASGADDKIAWYENNGAESFTIHIVTTSANNVLKVIAADIDGDGDMDLASASFDDDKIAWYENDGTENFNAHTVTTGADGARSVVAADIDGDGDMDLASASELDNTIAWYENDGAADPGFSAHDVNTSAEGARDILTADIEGDGDMDLVYASFGGDTFEWLENDGTESFIIDTLGSVYDGARSVFVADMDGDGDVDILASASFDNSIAWFETKDILKITNLIPIQNAQAVDKNSDISITFNEKVDGSMLEAGIIISGSQTGSIAGTFTGGGTTAITFNPSQDFKPGETISVTLNKVLNGLTENAVFSSYTFQFTVASEVVESSGFRSATVSTGADAAQSVFAADIDGDGDMDLASASYNDDKIAWYENNGAEGFTAHTVTTGADEARSVFAADIDGDGDMDLASASTIDDKIAWYENDGNEGFTAHTVTTGADGAQSVVAADIDGDGDMDLASASVWDDKIAWYENDGNEGFTAHTVTTGADGAQSVVAADIDGDGDMDLASASYWDNKIAWYENDGNEGFTAHTVTTGAGAARSVVAADIDGDGDMDLASASSWDDKIAWYENDGNKGFTAHTVTTGAGAPRSVVAADIDGDGDMDLVSASQLDDKIAWYEQVELKGGTERISGGSVQLDGTNGYISTSDSPFDLTSGFTLEAWVKPDTLDRFPQRVFSKQGAYGFGYSSTFLRFTTYGIKDYDLSFSGLEEGKWNHLAVVFTSSFDAVFYVNGDSVGTVTGSSTSNLSNHSLFLGGGHSGEYMDGKLDEVRVWNTERSTEQIRRHMFQSLQGNESGLLGYWPLNEVSGNLVFGKTSDDPDGEVFGEIGFSNDAHSFGSFVTGDEGWRILTVPAGGITFTEFLEPFWTQGYPGADIESGAPNVFLYEEGDGDSNASGRGFQTISNATDTVKMGQAIAVYVFEDDDPTSEGIQGGFPKKVHTDSSQYYGQVAHTLTLTKSGEAGAYDANNDGWNLVGNPYGATINWDAETGWNRSGVDNTIYVWSDSANNGTGAYLTWNGLTGTLGDGYIAPLQGFWVKANNEAPPSISVNDTVRSAGAVLRKQVAVPKIGFTLNGNGMQSKSIVMFSEKAATGKDPLDAYKLASYNAEWLSLSTTIQEESAMDIQALPAEMNEPIELALGIDGSDVNGEFTLSWNKSAFPEGYRAYLMDSKRQVITDLLYEEEYSFFLEGPVRKQRPVNPLALLSKPKLIKTEPEQRFTLILTDGQVVSNEWFRDFPREVELDQNYPNPFNPSTTIQFGVPEAGNVTLEVFDILGRKVATLLHNETKSAGRHQVRFDARDLASGMYLYRLVVGNKVLTKKLTLIK